MFVSKIKFLLLFVLLTVLSGCAVKVSESELQNIGNVGVYSNFTDEMHNLYVGITVFENRNSSKSVPDWNIKSFSEQEVINNLAKSPYINKTGLIKTNNSKFKSVMKSAKNQGYDTAVFITPTSYENIRYLKPGYGVLRRSAFGLGGATRVYAQFMVEVYDVDSQERIAIQWGFDGWNSSPVGESLGKEVWKDEPSNYTASELKIIEGFIKDKIKDGIRFALGDMNLIE